MVNVLQKQGLELDFPFSQTCCGQPAFNAGHHKAARSTAIKFLNDFEQSEVIVSPSGSCVNMIRKHYPELFADDPQLLSRAQAVAAKTYELTEFLVDGLKLESTGASYPARVTYHSSCHLNRFQGIDRQPRILLENLDGITLVEMKDADKCCGFGGTFSVKYADISQAMLEEKVQNIVDAGVEVVTGCDMSCLMNIQGMINRKNLDIQVLHIAQLLAGK